MGTKGEPMTEYQDPNYKDPNYKISEEQTPAAESSATKNLASEDKDFAPNDRARLGGEEKINAVKNGGIIYLPVGPMKFILMCLCVPYHGYEIWWLYKNFVCQKERGGKIASPLWRLNLPLLYLRKLLEAMRDEGKPYGLDKELPIEKIMLYWCMLAVCLVFPAPASALGIFSFAPFIFVNKYLIKLNQAANPDQELNVKITPTNYLVIIAGGAYFAVNLYLNYFMHF
jgi:hypothetical protein